MHLLGRDGEGECGIVLHDRVGRFHEKKRRLAVWIVAHLARMVGVVASDAVDAAYRKAQLAPGNGQRRHRADVDCVLGGAKIVFHLLPFSEGLFLSRQCRNQTGRLALPPRISRFGAVATAPNRETYIYPSSSPILATPKSYETKLRPGATPV